jgi:hypothetical protein
MSVRRGETGRQQNQEQVERSVDDCPGGLKWNEAIERQLGGKGRPAANLHRDEDVERDQRYEMTIGAVTRYGRFAARTTVLQLKVTVLMICFGRGAAELHRFDARSPSE